MSLLTYLPPGLSALDIAVVAFLVVLWPASGWFIENAPRSYPSVSILMRGYRREWMEQIIDRDPRVFDASIQRTLTDSTAFFASACMIAIGGGVALIGNVEWVRDVAGQFDIAYSMIIAWEVKIMLSLGIVARAFLSFVWSSRLHSYCAVVMATIPNDDTDPRCMPRTHQAAELNIAAARHFSAGLRAIYYALGALGWLIGPWGLLGATLVSAWWVLGREFTSRSRLVMLQAGMSAEQIRR